MADDGDLNQYMGIKKYAPYRKGANWDKQRPERLKELRGKLITNTRVTGDCEGGTVQVRKRKGKKERQKVKAAAGVTGLETQEVLEVGGTNKRKSEKSSEATQVEVEQSSSKKRKRRHRKSSQLASAE